MSADQAARAALAALIAASSVHVRGTFTADRRGERFDMRFEGNSASGSFTFKGAPVQTVIYGGSVYMKAGTDGWTAMGNPPNTAGMMAGTWCPIHRTMEELSITRPDIQGSVPWGAVDAPEWRR